MLLASPLAAQEALELGEKLLSKRDLPGAEVFFRQAIRKEPGSWRAHAGLFMSLQFQHKAEEALAEGDCAVSLAPDNVDLRVGYAQALQSAQRPLEAARHFERAVVAMPGKPLPLRGLARSYALAEDPHATAAYEEFLGLFPEDVGARLGFADYLFKTGQEYRGNHIMSEVVSIAPFNAELHVRYGEVLFGQQRFLDAVEELRQARQLASKSYPALYLLGNALWQAGKTGEAIEALEEAVSVKPDKAEAQHDLGKLLTASGEPGKAIPYLEKATQLRSDAGAWLDLGRAYEAAGRLPEAEQSYRKAVTLAPNLSPRYSLGRLLVREGKRAEGQTELTLYRQAYDKAARAVFESYSRHAEMELALSELNQGNASAALARYKSLPETPDSLMGQAKALSRLDRHAEAVSVLERASLLAPENRSVQTMLTAERQRLEEAR